MFLKLLEIEDYRRYLNSYVDLEPLGEVQNKTCRKYCKYWKLTKNISLKYSVNSEFRNRIHLLVENSRMQIALNLSGCDNISDVSSLGNVHTLNLSELV